AETCEDPKLLQKYPYAGSIKLDGIRCVHIGQAVSRKFKPIPNNYIRTRIEAECRKGSDGEIIIPGLPLNEINSIVMSRDGEPANFEYHIFDHVDEAMGLNESYGSRMYRLERMEVPGFVRKVLPVKLDTLEELMAFENATVAAGHEGI